MSAIDQPGEQRAEAIYILLDLLFHQLEAYRAHRASAPCPNATLSKFYLKSALTTMKEITSYA